MTMNGKPGYQDGAIVRVKLRNFVTYQSVEFCPGPQLNMVIGPNGTGKSSLVCAICLGLGYNPNHLGRASTIGEFVKHGQPHADVEIELAGRLSNHIIGLRIFREDNSRRWWLNGEETTLKIIKNLTSQLAIQIDNLCQFLPQDKVASFAGLSPVQLLHETLRAAAPPEMIEWHKELSSLHKERKTIESSLGSKKAEIQKNEALQEEDEVLVARVQEREEIHAALRDLNIVRMGRLYLDAREDYHASTKRVRRAGRVLESLRNGSGPAMTAVKEITRHNEKVKRAVESCRTAMDQAGIAADMAVRHCNTFDDKVRDLEARIDAERKNLDGAKSRASDCRRKIHQLNVKLENDAPSFDGERYNRDIRAKEHEKRETITRQREKKEKLDELKRTLNAKKDDGRRIQEELQTLQSRQGIAAAHLQKAYPDAYQAYQWIKENQELFEKEVFGPPMLMCSLKDESFGDVVQSLMQENDFVAFTCQTRNDHKILSDQVFGKMGLSLSIKTCVTPLQNFRHQLSLEEVRRYGLDGFAVDYLDGPAPVLAMLCNSAKLHLAGVGLLDLNEDKLNEIAADGRLNSFAAGTTVFRISRRRDYGNKSVTTTRTVQPGRFWTDQPVDGDHAAELQRTMEEIKLDLASIIEQGKALAKSRDQDSVREDEIVAEIENLRSEKSELQKVYNQYKAIPQKINGLQQELQDHLRAMRESKACRENLELEKDDCFLEKAKAVLNHVACVEDLRVAHEKHLEAQIIYLESRSEVEVLEARNQNITARLAEATRNVQQAQIEKDELKAAANERLEAYKQASAAAFDDESPPDRISAMATEKSIEEIDEEISRENAKLDMARDVEPEVKERYDERKKEIEKMRTRLASLTRENERMTAHMEEIRGKWEPRLDAVVEHINDAFGHNFEQIGCAGEVSVHKDEDDLEAWAIQIKVRFREGEALQLLNQHRQSGGERAVSTIFYLMSLQSMAQSPFRVVDEINQGMDPRNERMVHERMVEIACREHTSQYFLITPKLLTGLRYDEHMTVLCIASGEKMHEKSSKLMNFKDMIARKREMNRQRIRAGGGNY